jgi:hypothetical protein
MLFADMDHFQINGFGTVGLTYQNHDDITYISSWRSNHGSTGKVSLQNDTKFGLQLDWQATEKIDFTVQSTIDAMGTNLEWANFKYTISDNHNIKIGKMRFPTAMYSDILQVSYSYNWVRLPEAVYGILPLTSYCGMEYNYQGTYDSIEYQFKLYGGKSEDTMEGNDIGSYKIKLDHMMGANLHISVEDLEVRFGYTKTDITIDNTVINYYFLQAFQNSKLTDKEIDLLHQYHPQDKTTQYFSFGFKYEHEELYLLGEYIWIDLNNIISDNYAGYLSLGYHFGNFTPHITYLKVTGRSNYHGEIKDPVLNVELNEMADRTLNSQENITVGLRYDWKENIALKLQYDHIRELDKGHGLSIHRNQPYVPETIHLFSLSMDFIF